MSGRDIDRKLLELHGIKADETAQFEMAVKSCPRCQLKNAPVSKFCNRCGLALDVKTALEVNDKIRKAEDILETLLEDPSVKVFLAERMRRLGLATALS